VFVYIMGIDTAVVVTRGFVTITVMVFTLGDIVEVFVAIVEHIVLSSCLVCVPRVTYRVLITSISYVNWVSGTLRNIFTRGKTRISLTRGPLRTIAFGRPITGLAFGDTRGKLGEQLKA